MYSGRFLLHEIVDVRVNGFRVVDEQINDLDTLSNVYWSRNASGLVIVKGRNPIVNMLASLCKEIVRICDQLRCQGVVICFQFVDSFFNVCGFCLTVLYISAAEYLTKILLEPWRQKIIVYFFLLPAAKLTGKLKTENCPCCWLCDITQINCFWNEWKLIYTVDQTYMYMRWILIFRNLCARLYPQFRSFWGLKYTCHFSSPICFTWTIQIFRFIWIILKCEKRGKFSFY